jgi:hypothetical protein
MLQTGKSPHPLGRLSTKTFFFSIFVKKIEKYDKKLEKI